MPDLNNIIDYGIGPFPDVPEEVFAEIGCRLVLLQNFELMLSVVAKVAFETDPFKAKEAILRSDSKYPPVKPGALMVNRSKRLTQILGRLKAAS